MARCCVQYCQHKHLSCLSFSHSSLCVACTVLGPVQVEGGWGGLVCLIQNVSIVLPTKLQIFSAVDKGAMNFHVHVGN
jgi:hypothetical protein